MPIPTNPVTLWINGQLTEASLNEIQTKFLPSWEIFYTSKYRSQEQNRKIGGAADSAHQYNLARDFVLKNRATGKIATDAEMKSLFDKYIKPNWPDYTYFSPKTAGTSTGWIHANLPRAVSENTKFLGFALSAISAGFTIRKVIDYFSKPKPKT